MKKDELKYKEPAIHSSVSEVGESVTQVITMMSGYKKTFRGVLTKSIMQGEFTHFNTRDGRKVMVRTDNVAFVETTKEE